MLPRIQLNWRASRHLKPKKMLRVARNTRRIAMPPARVDVIDVFKLPVQQSMAQPDSLAAVNARFLKNLPLGGFAEILIQSVFTSRDRLPEVWAIDLNVRSFDQQHLHVSGVDDNQNGLGNFV